jgi:hypothetical protein
VPTTRFETTINALKEGAKSFTAEKAVTNIEGWEEYLSKHEHAGVKSVVADLGKLKKLLQAGSLDGASIRQLLHKLGKDTASVAGKEESAVNSKVHELAKLLSAA